MEELTVIKEITQAEKNAYYVLKELGLSSVTIPHEIDGMELKMQRGIHPERLGLDFPELYRQALSPLYNCAYESYSPGLTRSCVRMCQLMKGRIYNTYVLLYISLIKTQKRKLQIQLSRYVTKA